MGGKKDRRPTAHGPCLAARMGCVEDARVLWVRVHHCGRKDLGRKVGEVHDVGCRKMWEGRDWMEMRRCLMLVVAVVAVVARLASGHGCLRRLMVYYSAHLCTARLRCKLGDPCCRTVIQTSDTSHHVQAAIQQHIVLSLRHLSSIQVIRTERLTRDSRTGPGQYKPTQKVSKSSRISVDDMITERRQDV